MIVQFKLPKSGWEVDVEAEPNFGDFDAIDSYVTANTQGSVNPDTGKWEGKVPGTVLVGDRFNKVSILVKNIRNQEGGVVPGPVLETIKIMHPADGKALIKFVEETFSDYKKKLGLTEAQ